MHAPAGDQNRAGKHTPRKDVRESMLGVILASGTAGSERRMQEVLDAKDYRWYPHEKARESYQPRRGGPKASGFDEASR